MLFTRQDDGLSVVRQLNVILPNLCGYYTPKKFIGQFCDLFETVPALMLILSIARLVGLFIQKSSGLDSKHNQETVLVSFAMNSLIL
jgi:hypothetical protein